MKTKCKQCGVEISFSPKYVGQTEPTIEQMTCWQCKYVPESFRFADEREYLDKMSQYDWMNLEAVRKAVESRKSLYLVGDCGKGKTRSAWIVAKRDSLSGQSVRALDATRKTLAQLVREINWPGLAIHERDKALDSLKSVDVLFIDDFCKGKPGEAFWELAFEIIDARTSNGKKTIITANKQVLESAPEHYRASLTRRIEEFFDVVVF